MESADRPLAEEVCDILDRSGAEYALPIQSSDPAENRRDLEQNLAECDALIVVYGATTVTWVRRQLIETRKALASRQRPLRALGVFEGPPDPKDRLDMKFPEYADSELSEGRERGRAQEVPRQRGRRGGAMTISSPYRPQAVPPRQAHIFFGREEQTDELLRRLSETRFLAVVGPSGCGKSSLMRAGMIAALETGFMVPAGPRWRFVVMRPGSHPMRRLAVTLIEVLLAEGVDKADALGFLNATLQR